MDNIEAELLSKLFPLFFLDVGDAVWILRPETATKDVSVDAREYLRPKSLIHSVWIYCGPFERGSRMI